MKHRAFTRRFMEGLLVAAVLWAAPARAEEPAFSPWSFGLWGGWMNTEGDEEVRGSFAASAHVGYDASERWTLEGTVDYLPEMKEDFRTDVPTATRVSRLEENTAPGVHDTLSVRLSGDALFHLLPRERVDPYIAIGVGLVWYEEDFDNAVEPALRLRAGSILNIDDTWAVRIEACGMVAGTDTDFNLLSRVGISRRFGAEPRPVAAAAPVAPAVPVEPAEPAVPSDASLDSDFDGLTDRAETETHHTDPHKRDTDGGGVADGHEVIEDKSDPLKADDDLQLFELQMNFDPGSAVIRSEYYSDLDAIGKLLQSDAGATARIEGHVDRKPGSEAKAERRLTRRRADAIEDYFRKNLKISSRRLTSAGYGFDRPKAANDPVAGNPQNSRMEIYIRASKAATPKP